MARSSGIAAARLRSTAEASNWRHALPVLRGRRVVLRELRSMDAPTLCALLTADDVSRFTSMPPATVEGFEQFIAWTRRQRAAGKVVCFAVTLAGSDRAIGIIQVRTQSSTFDIAEWGFAIGSAHWGTGVFAESADLVLAFVFNTLETRRLEARATVLNGRGNGALMKIGAVHEGVLRRSLRRDGETFDQALYAILHDEWRANRGRIAASSPQIH